MRQCWSVFHPTYLLFIFYFYYLFIFNFIYLFIYFYFIYLYFGPCLAAYGILVPWPGIEPMPSALRAQSLNHWTDREVPIIQFLINQWKPSDFKCSIFQCQLFLYHSIKGVTVSEPFLLTLLTPDVWGVFPYRLSPTLQAPTRCLIIQFNNSGS